MASIFLTPTPAAVASGDSDEVIQGVLFVYVADTKAVTQVEDTAAQEKLDLSGVEATAWAGVATTVVNLTRRPHRLRDTIWPCEVLPWPTGFATYTFAQHDPARNRHREYRLTYQTSLWDVHTVQRSWGRFGGQHPRHHDCSFETGEEALTHLRRLLLKRYRRGYTLNWFEGDTIWLPNQPGEIDETRIGSKPKTKSKHKNKHKKRTIQS